MTNSREAHLKKIRHLNATPLSQHVVSLMKQRGREVGSGLALVSLGIWALDGLPEVEPRWLEERVDALIYDAMRAPRLVYENLAEAQEILDATTLEEAAHLLLQHLADIYPS